MDLRRKIAGSFFVILILTYELHSAILVLASTNGQTGSYEMAGNAEGMGFLRRQLESATPPEGPLLERSYVIPSGMDLSLADEVWLKIAPLISLGYGEKEIVKAVNELGLPRRVEADGASILLDYANLRVTRSLENGEVSLDIPIACNSSLSSVCYEVKGVRKHVKLYNVTSIKYYNVSVRASDLYEVAYTAEETGGFSKAMLDLKGDIKNNVIDVYLPGLDKPVFSEICFNLPSYGVTLSLGVLENKVYDIGSGGRRVDCYWIRVNVTLRASRDIWRVMFRIGHGGGWVNRPWLILRKGGYASDHWVKWTPNDKLVVDFNAEGFGNRFILNFGKLDKVNYALSRVLSEDELKILLEQPPYVKLDLSKAPKSLNIRLVGEKVTNETVWVTSKEYERLARLGWKEKNSIFTGSGETEWEYAITNKTLGQCNSIKLFYNPLKVNRGELVHGLTLRNYADTNVSYTLRLRTTMSLFFLFSKVEEGNGGVTLNKTSASSLLLVQQEPATGDAVLELVKDGRVIAGVKVSLALKATMYWKGFWDGLATKLPGIIVTAGVMIAMGFLIPHAYIRPAYYLLLGLGVLSNLAEVALDITEANKAREEMLTLAEAFENRSREFLARGEAEHAAECTSFAHALRREVNKTTNNLMLNVLSDLTVGVSLEEIRIALGLKEPLARDELERQYKIGYARGRVAGAAISCVLYVTLFIMVNRIKVERVGQRLTAGQVLRMMAKGIYNWITPPIWDAVILMRGKIGGLASSVVDLLLGNKYSSRFGEAVGNLLEDVKGELPRVGDTLDASSGLSKHVLENVPSRESSEKILDALGSIIENYSPEEMEEKGKKVVRSVVSIWIKDGDEAIDSLNSWLSENAKDMDKVKALEDVLLKIGGDAAEGVGTKIGDIVDSYLNINGEYGKKLAEKFLDTVLKNPEKFRPFFMEVGEHEITVKKNEYPTVLLSGRVEGTFRVKVYWEYCEKSGNVEFWTRLEGDKIHIPGERTNEILKAIYGDVEGTEEIEVKVKTTRIYFYDYRLFFPTGGFKEGGGLMLDLYSNRMNGGGREYSFEPDAYVWEGKLRVAALFSGAKNWKGNILKLIFIDDGSIEIKYGENVYPIRGIEFDEDNNAIRITYEVTYEHPSRICTTVYSFKHESLDCQLNKRFKLKWDYDVEGKSEIGLKERRLLTCLGYDALKELENRIDKRVDDNQRVILHMSFDNGKSAYCWNNELVSPIPPEAKIMTSIEVIPLKDLMNLKKLAIKVLDDPQDTFMKGNLGEAITDKLFMDDILTEIAKRSSIPKDKLEVELLGKSGRPDFQIKVSGTDERIAVIEVKYVGDPGDVKVFERQIEGAGTQIKNRFEDPEWTADYGVIVVIAWSPGQILGDESYPLMVGSYKNPYIEFFSKEGG